MRCSILALTAALAPASLACSGTREMLDVSYDHRFGESTTMDIYVPDEAAGPRPGIMFIHGGGWSGGSKDHYTAAAKRMAESGFVAATIEYRLVPEGKFPHAVQDSLCALSWLRRFADDVDLDPDRLAVMGYSAGGHLASLLGVAAEHPDLAPDCDSGSTGPPQAVIPGAGPQDLRGADNGVVEDFVGGAAVDLPEQYALASPITHVAPGKPPYLFFHGDADSIVPIEQSRAMRTALVDAGNQADLLELGGVGHLFTAGADLGSAQLVPERPEVWLAVGDFLRDTIGAPP